MSNEYFVDYITNTGAIAKLTESQYHKIKVMPKFDSNKVTFLQGGAKPQDTGTPPPQDPLNYDFGEDEETQKIYDQMSEPELPEVEMNASDAPKDAGVRTLALEKFEKQLGNTDVSKITPRAVELLAEKFAEDPGNIQLKNQLKLAKGYLALKNAPISDGEIDVDDRYGKGALSKAKQEVALAGKTGTMAEGLFPETFEASRDDDNDGVSFRKWAATLEDLTTMPARVVIATFQNSDSEADFLQKMAINSSEDTDLAELTKEALNVVNFIPGTKAPAWIASKAKYLALKGKGKGVVSGVLNKVSDVASKVDNFAMGAVDDVAENIVTQGMPSYIVKAMGKYAPKAGGDMKIPRALTRAAIDDMPTVAQDALFRLTNGNDDDSEILMDLLIGTSVGGFLKRKVAGGSTSRIAKPLDELKVREAPFDGPEDLLEIKGIETEGYQYQNIKDALKLVEDAVGEKSKDLDIILKDFDIDISDILKNKQVEASGIAGKASSETIELAKTIEGLTTNGVISGDKLRKEIQELGKIAFDLKGQSKTASEEQVKGLWAELRNAVVDGLPGYSKESVSNYFDDMASLNSKILGPIKKGKGYEGDIDGNIESILNKLRRNVAKPGSGKVSSSLTPLFALSREAKDLVTANFKKEMSGKSIGEKEFLKRRRDRVIQKFSFAGNELRQLRYLTDEFGETVGLSKFLDETAKGGVGGMLSKVVSALKPFITKPSKAVAKGARLNVTDIINAASEYATESDANGVDIGEGIDTKESLVEEKPKGGVLKNKVDPVARKKLTAYTRKHNQDFKTGDSGVRSDGADYKTLDPMMSAMSKTYKDMGFTDKPTITSITDGDRSKPSYHDSGRGIDYRSNHLPFAKQEELRDNLQENLGGRYEVILHKEKGDEYHIHVEPSPSY